MTTMRPDDARRILPEDDALERADGASRDALPDGLATREPPARPMRKPLVWLAALICLALLAATGGETWSLWQAQQAVDQAQSPGVIEREARHLGYIEPGDTPVIIAQP